MDSWKKEMQILLVLVCHISNWNEKMRIHTNVVKCNAYLSKFAASCAVITMFFTVFIL